MSETKDRSTEEVFANHLLLRKEKAAAEDICRDLKTDRKDILCLSISEDR